MSKAMKLGIVAKYLVFSIIITFFGCGKEDIDRKTVIDKLINEKVNERIHIHRENKLERCKTKAIDKAEVFVNKKMIKEFKHMFKDTLSFPEKPIKPPMPENLYLDTIGASPIGEFKINR